IKENLSSLSIESLQRKCDLRKKAPYGMGAPVGQFKAKASSKGNTRIPVILVQYQDKKFKDSDPKATFNSFFNATGSGASTITRSVKEYFRNQSKNQYVPTFELFGPITLSGKRADYGGNDEYGRDKGVGKMVAEAVLACDPQINYSQYDYSKDGYCDTVIILYAGDGENSSMHSDAANAIWPCHWSLYSSDYGKYLTLDNIRVNSFGVFNELNGSNLSKIDGIGTVCHEFSHCLGLPDFYDTNYGANFGMGYWSVMADGSYNNGGYTPVGYSAYEKEFMGWLSITESSPNSQYSLNPMNQNSSGSEQAVKIISDINPNEYFILESRKKQGWDEYMDAEGLMITHVTYDEDAWLRNEVNTGLQRMTIMPADNNLLLSLTNGRY
ncbi:MAG: M6 family metalloprotease domain-containing protein, partial [Muribaculaceae bacterium]|nr:M6 family metalloprotease domain-containing protein [Muribaculaceae bacterium]